MLYLVAGTDRAVKIKREDVRRIEDATRKMVEEMLEGELNDAMENLGIHTLALTDDEKQITILASKYVLAGYFLLTSDEPP